VGDMSAKDTTSGTAGDCQANPPSHPPVTEVDGGRWYQVKVKGHLDPHWSDWLGGLEITYDEQGATLLSGMISDQAALFGVLLRLRDLGVTLVGLACREQGRDFVQGVPMDHE